MRKSKIIGLSLCALIALTGCSCNKNKDNSVNANINNGEVELMSGLKEGVNSVTLEEIYNNLKAESGNTVAANKLLEIIADIVLSDATWQSRYDEKIEEKLLELTKNSDYQVDGEFNEELLVEALKAQLYNVTCTDNNYGPTYKENGITVDKYLLCDYTDYADKALKLEVLKELLNEKYVYDKVLVDKPNILSTKKARLVEYIELDSTKEDAFKFFTDKTNELIVDDSTLTLEDISEEWRQKFLDEIDEEYAKIGTKEDSSGSIFANYTGTCTYKKNENVDSYSCDKEVGLRFKRKEIYDSKYHNKVTITSDNKDILNSTLIERLLSENVLEESAGKTIKINDSYYLVSPLAGSNIDATDIRITDTVNKKYYIVKVEVINAESSEDLKYEAVKVLAKNTSLVSDSINYYLEQNKNKISVHDEEIYTYLKTLYSNIFVD